MSVFSGMSFLNNKAKCLKIEQMLPKLVKMEVVHRIKIIEMSMKSINKVLEGKELDEYFEGQILFLKDEFMKFISQFDATDLFHKWREFIRHVDELYNITDLITEKETEMLESCSINICKDYRFGKVVEIIGNRYGKAVRCRFVKSCLMLSSLNYAYIKMGQYQNCYKNLREAIDRCQKMRLYYVTMLLFVPQYAKGSRKIDFLDLLNFFQPQIDMCLVNIRTAYNSLLINRSINDYKAIPNTFGFSFNFDYKHLEEDSLEPIRLSEEDVMNNMTDEEKSRVSYCPVKQLCGYDEMLDGIKISSAVFEKYGLNELEEYKEMVGMAQDLKPFLKDDYAFIVPETAYMELKGKYPLLNLTCNSGDFDDMLNARPGFFKFEDVYYSTVLFYQRYMVNMEQRLLEKKKKFQVDSGFAFEKTIKAVLSEYGYTVMDCVKRIMRKEFDVVCVKDDCIYNFQCKNNFVSVSEQGKNWFKDTCNAIRRLNRYYEKALEKEDKREYLLKDKLKKDTVKSYVLSRYPVITRNPRVINYNQLVEWLCLN